MPDMKECYNHDCIGKQISLVDQYSTVTTFVFRYSFSASSPAANIVAHMGMMTLEQ